MNTIFIASYVIFERPAKIALSLKLLGYNVILLYCKNSSTTDTYFKDCFSTIIKINNSNQLHNLIKHHKVKFIHVFSLCTDPLALNLVKNKSISIIYDYKDIFEGLINIPSTKYIHKNQEYLIRNSDYICNRDLQIIDYQRIKGLTNLNKYFYPDLVWPNTNLENNEIEDNFIKEPIKLVLIGNFIIEKLQPEWSGQGYLHIFEILIRQGFEIHLYATNSNSKSKYDFSDYINLSIQTKKLIIHDQLEINKLNCDLIKYDFGILLPQFLHTKYTNRYVGDTHLRTTIPTRIMDYIGAGLPILFSSEWRILSLVNKYHPIGIPVPSGTIDGLYESVSNCDYKMLKKSVNKNARYIFNSRLRIHKLLKLYKKFDYSLI